MATKKAKSKSPLQVGNKVLVRTVTHYLTGEIVEVSELEIVLEKAAWIADTGRFNEALVSGSLCEVEPFPSTVSVGRGAIVDATLWTHALPTTTK